MKFTSTLLALTLASLTLAQTPTPIPTGLPDDTPVTDSPPLDCDMCSELPNSPAVCSPEWLAALAVCKGEPCNRDYANDPAALCTTGTTSLPTGTGTATGTDVAEPTDGSMTILPTTEAGDGPNPTDAVTTLVTTTTTGVVGAPGGGNQTSTRTRSPVPTGEETDVPGDGDGDEEGVAAVHTVGGSVAALAVGLLGVVGLVL